MGLWKVGTSWISRKGGILEKGRGWSRKGVYVLSYQLWGHIHQSGRKKVEIHFENQGTNELHGNTAVNFAFKQVNIWLKAATRRLDLFFEYLLETTGAAALTSCQYV